MRKIYLILLIFSVIILLILLMYFYANVKTKEKYVEGYEQCKQYLPDVLVRIEQSPEYYPNA